MLLKYHKTKLQWRPQYVQIFLVLTCVLGCAHGELNSLKSSHHQLAPAARVIELPTADASIRQINDWLKPYSAEETLIVLDLDNTLLRMPEPLGSDQWFSWQERLLNQKSEAAVAKSDSTQDFLVGKDFADLIAAQDFLFYMQPMALTAPVWPKWMEKLQDQGVRFVALTSRGWEFAYSTIRDLTRNRVDFSRGLPRWIPRFFKPTPPFKDRAEMTQRYAVSDSEAERLKLSSKSRPVQYLDGVFYTAGQHKGLMLRILLKELKLKPRLIVFVDDKEKHTTRVQEAFEAMPEIDVRSIRFSSEDEAVKVFDQLDKSELNRQYIELKSVPGGY